MKNTSLKTIFCSSFFAAFFLAATIVGFAQVFADRSNKNYVEHYLGCYARNLDLTEAQRAQMSELINSFREQTKNLREQLTSLCDHESEPTAEGSFNEQAVRAAAQSRANLRVELEVAQSRLNSQLVALLTAEQKAKLAEQKRKCSEQKRVGQTQ